MSDDPPGERMDDDSVAQAVAGPFREAVPDHTRRSIERWLAARGVPQLIAGYSSEQRIDARAFPLISVWIVVATVLIWIVRPEIYFAGRSLSDLRVVGRADRPFGANFWAMLLALVATGLVIGAFLWVRRHPPFRSHARLDVVDIAVVGLVPGIVAAGITGDPGAAPGIATFVLSGVGIIYAVVALGIPELTGWGLRHLRENLPHIATLVARTLPLLLILVVFLLFAAEMWQAAQALGVGDLVAVTVLLAIVGSVFVVTQAREEIRMIEDHDDATLEKLLTNTPAASLNRRGRLASSRPPLRRLELLNVVVLMLISQLIQALFVALMVAVFLVVLGMILVPAPVQDAWAGAPVRDLVGFVLLDQPRTLSLELLIVSALLGGMCGLYFTGLALTDATYRAESTTRVVADIQRIMAVRFVYLAMLDTGDPPMN
jgi:hypothetical protein